MSTFIVPLRLLLALLRASLTVIGRGIPNVFVIGLVYWIWRTFLASADSGAIQAASNIPGLPLPDIAGVGLIVLVVVILALGTQWIPTRNGRKHIGHFLSLGRLLGFATKTKLRNKPVVWVVIWTPETARGPVPIYKRALLLDVRYQKIESAIGCEKIAIYKLYIPSASNASSGDIIELEDPSPIKYIENGAIGRLVADTLSLGLGVNSWNRRRFNPDEFPPHDPDDPVSGSPGKN